MTSGSLRFLPINLPPGEWDARLFHEDTYDVDAHVAFTVLDPGADPAPAPVGDLTVMTFNTWLGAASVAGGRAKIAAGILAAGADVVCFQECPRGAGQEIADDLAALDASWVDAALVSDESDNVIISCLPLDQEVQGDGGYWVSGVLTMPDGAKLQVFGTHFDYTEYGPWLARDGYTVAEIEASEARVRGDDADRVLGATEPEDSDAVGGVLILGEHNAPSPLDWTAENADQDFDVVVEWPAEQAILDEGFVDAWRYVHPDPVSDRGLTWTAGYPKDTFDADDVHDRIDFIYARSGTATITPVQAFTYDADPWPSDHRAVVVSFDVSR